jgi:hypothetical protein
MKYALLIYDDDTAWANLSEEDKAAFRAAEMPRWAAAMEELQTADPKLAGYELDGRETAKVVRVRDGESIVTDGPFAETKEALGGAFVLELADLDEAIRLASLVPSADGPGAIEIRPILQ